MSKTFSISSASYFTSSGSGCYGPRVYVPRTQYEVCGKLKELSKWRGHDKEIGPMWGFEFGREAFEEAINIVKNAGFAELPEGGRAVVSRTLGGTQLDVFALTGGPGLAASLGASLAALHEVEATLAEDVGLPVYEAGECRTRLQAEVDQMAQTSRVPLDLLKRWERALEDVRCWRFRPTFVHGDLQAERVLVEGAEVVAFTGFTASYVGDPAVDLAWLLASAPEDAVESILEAYAFGRVEGGSGLLVERAQLLSEVALGRWLMHGLRHNDPVVTAEAEEMLADLAAAVIDAPEIIES